MAAIQRPKFPQRRRFTRPARTFVRNTGRTAHPLSTRDLRLGPPRPASPPGPPSPDSPTLQEIAGKVRQGRSFPFFQCDMSVDGLPHHAIDQVAQTVRQRIQVRLIDLLDVSGEDDLRPFPGPRDDGLDFVGRQVLGFVDDKEHPLQAAAADVGQGRDDEFFRFQHLPNTLRFGSLSLNWWRITVRLSNSGLM